MYNIYNAPALLTKC